MQTIDNLPPELQDALAPYLLVPDPNGRTARVVLAADNPNLTPRLVHCREGIIIIAGSLPPDLMSQVARYNILSDAMGRLYALPQR